MIRDIEELISYVHENIRDIKLAVRSNRNLTCQNDSCYRMSVVRVPSYKCFELLI